MSDHMKHELTREEKLAGIAVWSPSYAATLANDASDAVVDGIYESALKWTTTWEGENWTEPDE